MASFLKLEFRSVDFCGEGKTREPGGKPLGAEKRTNNKPNPCTYQAMSVESNPRHIGGRQVQ